MHDFELTVPDLYSVFKHTGKDDIGQQSSFLFRYPLSLPYSYSLNICRCETSNSIGLFVRNLGLLMLSNVTDS